MATGHPRPYILITLPMNPQLDLCRQEICAKMGGICFQKDGWPECPCVLCHVLKYMGVCYYRYILIVRGSVAD